MRGKMRVQSKDVCICLEGKREEEQDEYVVVDEQSKNEDEQSNVYACIEEDEGKRERERE